MGKKSLYTIRATSDSTYSITKLDEDLNPEGEIYHISELGPTGADMICTCPAGAKPTCRHRQMLRLFQAEDRIDKGWLYHFDKKQWIPPINLEG